MNSLLLAIVLLVLFLAVIFSLLFKKKVENVNDSNKEEIDYSMPGEDEAIESNSAGGKY